MEINPIDRYRLEIANCEYKLQPKMGWFKDGKFIGRNFILALRWLNKN